jgi:glucosylceramidase
MRAPAASAQSPIVAPPAFVFLEPEAHGYAKSFVNGEIIEDRLKVHSFSEASGAAPLVIEIDPRQRYQKMWGYGAALTESCLENLNRLSKDQRAQLMEKLFKPGTGAGLSFLRIPLGATDFSLNNFSLDDTENNVPDLELKKFNFERAARLISTLKTAQRINPQMRFMMTAWSAPAWMKTTKTMNGGTLEPKYYDAYARYLIRALEEYEARGISIDYFSIVNEPFIQLPPTYPQMPMPTNAQMTFIKTALYPLLVRETKASRLHARLLLLDHNWDDGKDVGKMLDDATIASITAGVAFHCYSGDESKLPEIMKKHPFTPIFMSECTALTDSDPMPYFTFWTSHFIIDASRVGLTGSLGWNLCLDEKGGPQNNGCKNCGGFVTITHKNRIILSPGYHATEVVSRYVQPNATMIGSSDISVEKIQNVVFENTDGSRVFAARNDNSKSVSVAIRNEYGESTTVRIPEHGSVTLVWSNIFSSQPESRSLSALNGYSF